MANNPLFNELNQNPMDALIKQAQDFKKNFKGDAKAEVQNLINSGQISQAQLQRIMPLVNQLAAKMPPL